MTATATRTRKSNRKPMTDAQREAAAVERQQKVDALLSTLGGAVADLATDENWIAYLRTAAKFHRYSANNVLLLWIQGAARGMNVAQVAGYRKWQELGRQVRKGEKGLQVLAPSTRRVEVLDEEDRPVIGEDGQPVKRDKLVGFRVEHVWDVSQTDGDPLPQPTPHAQLVGHAPVGLWDAVAAQVTAAGYTITRGPSDHGEQGYTNYAGRIVNVTDGLSDAEATATLIHELGHILAEHDKHEMSAGQREAEAESIAFVVAAAFGLDTTQGSAPYVLGWSKGDPTVIRAAADRVRAVAARIIAAAETAETADVVDLVA